MQETGRGVSRNWPVIWCMVQPYFELKLNCQVGREAGRLLLTEEVMALKEQVVDSRCCVNCDPRARKKLAEVLVGTE